MPISADPNRTTPVWLESDKDKPIETRPVLLSRFLTGRQRQKIRELLDRAIALKAGDEAFQCVYDALKVGIVGWRNMTLPDQTPAGELVIGDEMREVLTDDEIQEIAWGYARQVSIGEDDLKNSASPAPSAQAKSAQAVETPAPIDPATEQPPTPPAT